MLSQFTGGAPGLRQLGDLGYDWPEGIHAVGRLDYRSEGLLLLTTDTSVTRRLFQGPVPHRREYLVQASRKMTAETLEKLRSGVSIQVEGSGYHLAVPAAIELTERPDWLVYLPHELRADIPNTWLSITLTEGKYHQVRKMLRAVGHPVRRLVRVGMEGMLLAGLEVGELREYGKEKFLAQLGLC